MNARDLIVLGAIQADDRLTPGTTLAARGWTVGWPDAVHVSVLCAAEVRAPADPTPMYDEGFQPEGE